MNTSLRILIAGLTFPLLGCDRVGGKPDKPTAAPEVPTPSPAE